MGWIRFSGTTFTIMSRSDMLTPPLPSVTVPICGTPPWNIKRPMAMLKNVAITVVHI